MTRKFTAQRIDLKFKHNLDKLYPNEASVRVKTKKLNSLLEELLYGKKKK